MNVCTKCGHNGQKRATLCGTCLWLLKLNGGERPANVMALGLPPNNDYDTRQASERIPFGWLWEGK